jgi:hypothetical protein
MGQYSTLIVHSARIASMYAQRLLAGVEASAFARTPVVGGTLVQTNHPAWVFGHLATYPVKIGAMVGIASPALAAPAGFEERFKDGTQSLDDPAGTIYPAMDVVTKAFFSTHDAMLDALEGIDDALLLVETTEEKYRQRFPHVGSRLIFMCNNHVMMHLGQVSAWRRCMGLPPA